MRKKYGDLKQSQLSAELGQMWQQMTDNEKLPYTQRAQLAKRRYDDEKARWDQLHPPGTDAGCALSEAAVPGSDGRCRQAPQEEALR
jgi:structure-specific recognition protein 1